MTIKQSPTFKSSPSIPDIMYHHYLPIFYTKPWVNELNNLLYYWSPHTKIVSSFLPPRALGGHDNLYTKKNLPARNKHSLETNTYSPIDNKAAPVTKKMIEGKTDQLTDDEHAEFSTFLHSLGIRHLHQVEQSKKLKDKIAQGTWQRMTAADKIKYKAEHEAFSLNLHITAMEALSNPDNQFGLTGQKDFVNAMNTLTWWVEDFSDTGFTLLTSDSPIQLIPTGNERLPSFNSSEINSIANLLNTKKYCLFIPLSPSIGFFASPQKMILAKNKKALIKKLNLVTVKSAKKFVVAQDKSHDAFIKKHLRHLIQ